MIVDYYSAIKNVIIDTYNTGESHAETKKLGKKKSIYRMLPFT